MKTAIGTSMLEVLKENECADVMWGDCYLLDHAFKRSASRAKIYHPLQRWQIVLNALDKDERFIKWYVKLDLFGNGGSRLVRAFGPINDEDK